MAHRRPECTHAVHSPAFAFSPTSPDGSAVGTGRGKGERWGVHAVQIIDRNLITQPPE